MMLSGKIFISTRPRGRSRELDEYLGRQGAGLLELPMIEIQKSEASQQEKKILARAGQFDWIVFTSTNGVIHFFNHLKDVTGSYLLGKNSRIAVIGRETGSGLAAFGHKPDYESRGGTGKSFASELEELFRGKNPKVLLPAGNLARRTIEKRLRGIAEVSRVNVYNTLMPGSFDEDALRCIREGNYEMIIFTSNSGFNNFCLVAGDRIEPGSLRVACIGSTTASAVRKKGIEPLVIAGTMSSRGIADAIIAYYRKDLPYHRDNRNESA